MFLFCRRQFIKVKRKSEQCAKYGKTSYEWWFKRICF